MVTIDNYKIMPALTMFLQDAKNTGLSEQMMTDRASNFDHLKVWIRSSIFIAPSKVASRFPFLSYMAR